MKRALTGAYELDDDRARIDVEAVHAFLSSEAYWAIGRSPEHVARLVREASRVVGLYHDGHQVGFCRAVSDDTAFAYLADVYVLPEHRGRGLGLELVREMVDRGPFARRTWILHTEDMHALYAKLGFREPSRKLLERPGTAAFAKSSEEFTAPSHTGADRAGSVDAEGGGL